MGKEMCSSPFCLLLMCLIIHLLGCERKGEIGIGLAIETESLHGKCLTYFQTNFPLSKRQNLCKKFGYSLFQIQITTNRDKCSRIYKLARHLYSTYILYYSTFRLSQLKRKGFRLALSAQRTDQCNTRRANYDLFLWLLYSFASRGLYDIYVLKV